MCKHMGTFAKLAGYFIVTIQLLCSCNNSDHTVHKKIDSTFKSSLIEKHIGTSNFYISLPHDYSIKIKDGPDFSVYYFAPTDTTVDAKFSGGLYFGSFPSEFDAQNDSCKTATIKGKILDNIADWTVYNCTGDYALQTIIDSKSGEEWNERIHAFGHAKSEAELNKILDIYSTLRQKKK
jgi:hypothetical protein